MVGRADARPPSSPSWLQFSFSDLISDSCRCSALHLDNGCLLLFCYKRVTSRNWTKVQYARHDSTANRSGPAPTYGAYSNAPRFLSGRRQVGGFDCSRDEEKLFEGHPRLAKAA